jgi:hypothetical protein
MVRPLDDPDDMLVACTKETAFLWRCGGFAGKFGKQEGMLALVKIPEDSKSVIYQLCNMINYWVTLQKSRDRENLEKDE